MSFIHKFIEDKNTSEQVKQLFNQFIYDFEKQNSIAWDKEVKQKNSDYHRKTILKQGRCDFDKPPLNLTSEELIVLYNYYYFPMHFQSSYEIYSKLFEEQEEFQNQTFFFHDFGCGTLSCTLAFALAMQSKNCQHEEYTTCGIFDLCDDLEFYYQDGEYEPILKKGFYTFGYPILQYRRPKYPNGFFLSDISASTKKYNKAFLSTEDIIDFFNTASVYYSEIHLPHDRVVAEKVFLGPFYCANSDEYPLTYFAKSITKPVSEITVILNFSYVLASESIDIESIKSLIEQYQKTGCKLIIVNQNPDLDSLNINWEQLKNKITFVKSVKGLQPIKHFSSKSKARFEVVFPTTNEILFEQFVALMKESKYYELEKQLNDYFKSNLFHPELFSVEVDMLNKRNYFDLCNYITDFAFSHNYLGIQKYYHQKAHLYRDINSINIAKSYYEKDIIERNGHRCICYKVFINKYFPEIKPFIINDDDDDLPF